MSDPDALIRTKLRLPVTRTRLVSRPRLQSKLADGLGGPLTLLTAPAGFGKTTLLAACVPQAGMPVAWLSLDKEDNQERRFLSYLLAALQVADPSLGSEAAQLLRASPEALPEAVLTSLINDFDLASREIALVLDDYQTISDQAVGEAVAFLLEHCPSSFHLVIASRSDPALPLARLRARGLIIELRAAELRFTGDEAAQFLNEAMGLQLDARSVAVLEQRTEGWIAGLQMAALSMQDRKDINGFIEGFSGTNRYILDYLLEEVLAIQPPEIQCFLLCTSVLERLSASLCKALLDARELEGWVQEGLAAIAQPSTLMNYQVVLEQLERANLFLMPLDDERRWYRYHQLFADLLRARLDQVYPGLAPQLHRQAAAWYEKEDSILDAIHHASVASDDERVERLIEQHYMEMVNRGEMSSIRFWMGKLSKDLIFRRPWLCLYEALSHSWFGELDEANLLLDEVEKRFSLEPASPDSRSMQGYHAFVKSRVTAMQGDTRQAIEYCRKARQLIPADNLALQNEFSITLGYEYFLDGDFTNAGKILSETIQTGHAARAINNPVAAYCLLARSHAVQGKLHEAQNLLQRAGQLILESGGQYLGATGLVETGTAALLCEWNELDAALVHIKRALELLPWWGKEDDFCLAYTTLWRIQLALGNPIEAADSLDKASRLIQSCGIFSEARSTVESTWVKMWLVQEDWPSINRWAASQQDVPGSVERVRFENELVHLARARIMIAQHKPDEAIRLLSTMQAAARSAGRNGRMLETLILKALALHSKGESVQAENALTLSLEIAEPEGYVRVYLDEGSPMQRLLAKRRAGPGNAVLQDYTIDLLSRFNSGPQVTITVQQSASPAGLSEALIEPLSQRELEVLQLIAQGKTNREIAQQLIISPGTVKAHTANIYRKLDVANRTEAAARARQIGILT